MPRLVHGAAFGMLAGAAGATALNATTYLDQALRGRPSSDTPGQTVTALADAAGIAVPGEPEQRANRLEGLGPLSGLAVGLGVGAAAGIIRACTGRVPTPIAALLISLAAMTISDSTMTALKISDPRSWTLATVAADALPHLAYGLTTAVALHRLLPRSPAN